MNTNTERGNDTDGASATDDPIPAHPRSRLCWGEVTGEYDAVTLQPNLAMTGFLFLRFETEMAGGTVKVDTFVHPDALPVELPRESFEADVTIRAGDRQPEHAFQPGEGDEQMAYRLHATFEYDGETIEGGVEQVDAESPDDWTRLWAAFWKECGPEAEELPSDGEDES